MLPVWKIARPDPPTETEGVSEIEISPPEDEPAVSFLPAFNKIAEFVVLVVVRLAESEISLSAFMVNVPAPELIE